jgi:hypothetical protein
MANALGPTSGRGPWPHPPSIVVSSWCYVLTDFFTKAHLPSIIGRVGLENICTHGHIREEETHVVIDLLFLYLTRPSTAFAAWRSPLTWESNWGWKLINLVMGFLYCLVMLLTTALLVARPFREVSTIIHESMMWWSSILVRLSLWLFSQLGKHQARYIFD